MVAAQIKFVVVGHHLRRATAVFLAECLQAHLLIDEGQHGANWNHRRALAWARFPNDLCSFYLGTGRPPQYQAQIAERLIAADRTRADFITLPQLIHGVCYSVPPQHLPKVLSRWDSSKPADFALGDAWGAPVVYPCWSLVDHADGEPVERHPDGEARTERRRAWRVA